jgi:hypothetical protein
MISAGSERYRMIGAPIARERSMAGENSTMSWQSFAAGRAIPRICAGPVIVATWLKGDLELADFERDKGGTTGRDEEGTGRQKRKRRGTAGEIIAARLRRDRAFYWWLDQPEIKPRVAQPMSSLVRLARRVLD